jgi:hypothetical protein
MFSATMWLVSLFGEDNDLDNKDSRIEVNQNSFA